MRGFFAVLTWPCVTSGLSCEEAVSQPSEENEDTVSLAKDLSIPMLDSLSL